MEKPSRGVRESNLVEIAYIVHLIRLRQGFGVTSAIFRDCHRARNLSRFAGNPMLPLPLAFIGGPLGIVAFSILFIVFVIVVLRLHAFFALILAAAVVSLLTAVGQTGDGRFVKAIEAVMSEFGTTAGKLGFAIALAAVIGTALMESGAADKIVRRMIAVLGEGRAALAMCLTGFVLAAPVFADTVFMLMLPLARSLARRTGKDYILYVCAKGAGV